MADRLLLAVGLVLLAAIVYAVARNVHLRVVRRRLDRSMEDVTPGLAAFQPGQPAVLYFTTPSCVPCRTMVKPMLRWLITELGERFQVLEVNVEVEPEAARHWNVLSVPTIFVLDPRGKPRHVHYGVASQDVIRSQLNHWLRPSGKIA